jgi:hypothetical protein
MPPNAHLSTFTYPADRRPPAQAFAFLSFTADLHIVSLAFAATLASNIVHR